MSEPKHWPDSVDPGLCLIRQNLENDGVHRWTTARVEQLAKDLGWSLPLVCARAGMFCHKYDKEWLIERIAFDTKLVRRCMAINAWPIPVALHFDLLETELKVMKGDGAFLSAAQRIDGSLFLGIQTK